MEGWIALTRTSTITSKPQPVRLRDVKLITYRKNNRIHLIPESCQHRGMSLLKGKVQDDGSIECAYHGWTYNENGWCMPNLRVCGPHEDWFKYNTVQQDGLLWIQPIHLANPALLPPKVPYVDDEEFRTVWFETTIHAPAQLILENGIDPNHASWVHANSFGFGTYKHMPTNVKHSLTSVSFNYIPNKDALSSMLLNIDTTHNIHNIAYPYTTWSDVVIGDKTLMTYVTLCPEDDRTTRMFVGFSHNTGLPNWILVNMGRAIVEQDRAILENLEIDYMKKGICGVNDDLIEEYRKILNGLIFK
jgi:phenylpropionate dioxygenase-like ring-hydroxylating dioxygenase large terminal subunit